MQEVFDKQGAESLVDLRETAKIHKLLVSGSGVLPSRSILENSGKILGIHNWRADGFADLAGITGLCVVSDDHLRAAWITSSSEAKIIMSQLKNWSTFLIWVDTKNQLRTMEIDPW